jgi:hypothetical protein
MIVFNVMMKMKTARKQLLKKLLAAEHQKTAEDQETNEDYTTERE